MLRIIKAFFHLGQFFRSIFGEWFSLLIPTALFDFCSNSLVVIGSMDKLFSNSGHMTIKVVAITIDHSTNQ